MFLIYLVISLIYLFVNVLNGVITSDFAQIWVLTTLSVAAIVYGLEVSKNGR